MLDWLDGLHTGATCSHCIVGGPSFATSVLVTNVQQSGVPQVRASEMPYSAQRCSSFP